MISIEISFLFENKISYLCTSASLPIYLTLKRNVKKLLSVKMHYKNLAFAYLFLRFSEAIFTILIRRLHVLLQRLMPIDFAHDLFLIRAPEVVLNKFYHYRPYTPADEVNYLPVYSKRHDSFKS